MGFSRKMCYTGMKEGGRNVSGYEDLLKMPHPEPRSHKRMSMTERGAQFLPYATLGDYFDSVDEQNRETMEQIELSEEDTARLNGKLHGFHKGDAVRVTYFLPDVMKDGGKYVTTNGEIRSIDPTYQTITLEDGQKIPFSMLLSVELCV